MLTFFGQIRSMAARRSGTVDEPGDFCVLGRMPKRGSLFATRFAAASIVDSKSSWTESMNSHFRRMSCGFKAGKSA
jgi:hypothetical protein